MDLLNLCPLKRITAAWLPLFPCHSKLCQHHHLVWGQSLAIMRGIIFGCVELIYITQKSMVKLVKLT